ncbi:Vesicle-associated membrane protein-associated protein A [Phytophthora palmivora]|uniref:Vesicle-associated membrane protein-associated protein A n=1 Tax=Phytophthora palmivora TaxID=4796 RepID=A0A2P4X1J2_9STRA|nr:Vesicle-associated membrane protein-associated protein A [Phytophthora palmivora]
MELEYGPSEALELSPQQPLHTLVLRNAMQRTLFKVQCTAPRKLRVRPALGFLAPGDVASIEIQLNPQECTSSSCKLLVVGRQISSPIEVKQLKAMWTAVEADPDSLVLSETVKIRIHDDGTLSTTPQLTTTQVADLVLLLMKSQSRREENKLTIDEQEQLKTARVLHASDWPCWEEYASRMRKLLRERKKRT